jgi:DNA-binding GntR family transcriptional regulator
MLLEPAGLLEPTFKVNPEQFRRCRERQLELLEGQVDGQRFFECNAEFHELLAAASGNSYILQAIQQQNRLRRLTEFHSASNVERVKVSCREHLAILDALEQGDNEWASTLLHRHLEVASKMGVARNKA